MRLAAAAVLLLAACSAPEPNGGQRLASEAVPRPGSAAVAPDDTATSAATAAALAELLEAERASGGTLGIAAVHVETGERLGHNGDEPFPMASTFKLPVALAVLARVDSGGIGLDDEVELAPSDFRPGPSPILDSIGPAGGRTTVRRLLDLMMRLSDNTATDRLMAMVGGTAGVTAHLRARGIGGISVDRTEGEFYWQYNGVRDVPPRGEWTLAAFNERIAAVPRARRDSARAAFLAGARDTATPEGFAALLAQVARGEGISAESRRFLLDAMIASPTGRRRIRGDLPAGTVVADKTGTIATSANDVGIVTLPDGSHVAVAVLVKGSRLPTREVEPAIARAARVVYDRFTGGVEQDREAAAP